MKIYRPLFLILGLVISLLTYGQNKPSLVVGIQISGLREDYLNMFLDELGTKGFKRLMTESTIFDKVYYPSHYAGRSVDQASLSTGTIPYNHGICTDAFYNPKSYKMQSFMLDKNVKGIAGVNNYSAESLICTTVADELNEHTVGISKIFSIAFDAENAVYSIGHSGTPLWIDKKTGSWSTSTYYTTTLPEWTNKHNIEKYLDRSWEPLYPAGYYVASRRGAKGFNYRVEESCNGPHLYENFSTTPFANTMITEMAIAAIDSEKMGKDLYTDLLYLNYNLENFYLNKSEGLTVELEDSYLRLDKELESLLDALDKRFNKENILVYIISDRSSKPTAPFNNKITYKEFNSQRYAALLNSYLMANYGQYKWVQACYDGHIYLDEKLAEEKNVSFRELQNKAIEFFSSIPGVSSVWPSYLLRTIEHNFSYHPQNSGDLIYTLQVGYYEIDSKERKTDFYNKLNKNILLMFWGGGFKNKKISDSKSVLMLAPTISELLKISSPNCTGAGTLLE